MRPIFKTLTVISAWTLFILGFVSVVIPVILGLTSGALAGSINTTDDGLLWWYRHGLSFVIGVVSFWAYFKAIRLLKDLD